MSKKRLITSGCSFTRYQWPTWPWALAAAYDETYNYAQSGAGNEYIFHSIIEADTALTLTPNDTVVIEWSGYTRFDYFNNEDLNNPHQFWQTNGEWHHHINQTFSKLYLSEVGAVHKTINYILATKRYLTAKNIPYLFTSLYDLRDGVSDLQLLATINEHILKRSFIFPNGLHNYVLEQRKRSDTEYTDAHPTPDEHTRIAHHIAQALNLTLTKMPPPIPAITIDVDKLQATGQYAILTSSGLTKVKPTVERYLPNILEHYANIL